jgi:HD-like signal output (HDOD) protein/CheY-like chemotaxis protein
MDLNGKSILFVDDERSILKALRRLFIDEEWDMHFATSGKEALEIMQQTPIDMVVSDFRMPEMDGAELLGRIKEKYPGIIRLMLTGYINREAVVRTLSEGNAQQLLTKPWNETELKEVIRKALATQAEQTRSIGPGLQKVINGMTSLPELPAHYHEIDRLIKKSPEISIDELTETIQQDVSLAADLLRWANSALFGQMHKVDTVKRAIVVIGVEVVNGLILSRTVSEILLAGTDSFCRNDIEQHQKHSMACAIIAKLLAGNLASDDSTLADRAFTAGLLHDLGILVEIGHMPTEFKTIARTSREKSISFLAGEEMLLHTNHAEIGGYLAEWWNLPHFLFNAIRWHHHPGTASEDLDLIATIHVADHLAHRHKSGISDNPHVPPLDEACRARLNLTEEHLEQLGAKLRKNQPYQDTN